MAHNFPSWIWTVVSVNYQHTWNFVLLLFPLPGIHLHPDPFPHLWTPPFPHTRPPHLSRSGSQCQDFFCNSAPWSLRTPLVKHLTHNVCVYLRSDPLSYPHLHVELTDQRLVSVTLSPSSAPSGLFSVNVYYHEIELNEATVRKSKVVQHHLYCKVPKQGCLQWISLMLLLFYDHQYLHQINSLS